MCFGSKTSTKPTPPTPSARFDYNVPQTNAPSEQQRLAAANAPNTDPLGQQQLGAATQGSY